MCTCPKKFSLQPYTGCPFSCLYCYATSYIKERGVPKKNFLERLRRDLTKIPIGSIINLSTSSDPYPPLEGKLLLTRKAIELLVKSGMKVLITTKSDLVSRDWDLIKIRGAVMITITTLDVEKAKALEPGAPSPLKRLEAIRELTSKGVRVGIRLDPVIPGVNDDPSEIEEVIREAKRAGAEHVVTSTYKAKPDNFKRMVSKFPHLKEIYKNAERVHGYLYLPKKYREKLLQPVVEAALRYGMTVATCREGLPQFFFAPSCDGSHMIGGESDVPRVGRRVGVGNEAGTRGRV